MRSVGRSSFRIAAGRGALLLGAVAVACRGNGETPVASGGESSVDSAFTVAGRRVPPALLNRYVAQRVGFTSRGGEMRCAYTPLGVSGDRVFVNTLCLELLRAGDSLVTGSGLSMPLALRVAADGDTVRVVSHEAPVDGEGHGASIRRIFPPDVAARIFVPAPAHNARVDRLERHLRRDAAARLGVRP